MGGALAASGLQDPQPSVLDGELDVLHVLVVRLEAVEHRGQLRERLGHHLFHGGQAAAGRLLHGDGQRLGRADPGHHVLALGIDQELAVVALLAGRRIAGEGDPGRAALAAIAEHHRLHVHRGAREVVDVVQAAVGDRARRHPRAEDGADRAPQLLLDVLREGGAVLRLDDFLIRLDQAAQIVGAKLGIEVVAVLALDLVEPVLEQVVIDSQHDVPVHLDEAPVAVVGEARIVGASGETLDRDDRSARG